MKKLFEIQATDGTSGIKMTLINYIIAILGVILLCLLAVAVGMVVWWGATALSKKSAAKSSGVPTAVVAYYR